MTPPTAVFVDLPGLVGGVAGGGVEVDGPVVPAQVAAKLVRDPGVRRRAIDAPAAPASVEKQ
jgi:hypothetical protein